MDGKQEPKLSKENTKIDELTEEYFGDISESNKKRSIISASFIAISALAFIFLGWYVYKIKNTIKTIDQLEIIKAENHITKVRPENPGGMNIPDMDKSIYDNLSTKTINKAQVEKILPAPEEPIIPRKNSDANNIIKDNKNTELDKTTVDKSQDNRKPITRPEIIWDNQEIEIEKNSDRLKIVSKETPQVKIVPKETPKEELIKQEREIKQKLAAKKKGYYVQIGSFKSESYAKQTWQEVFVKKYPSIVGKEYYVEKKDLGNKGLFYRLQAGPFKSESQARLVCQKLQQAGQNCFIAK